MAKWRLFEKPPRLLGKPPKSRQKAAAIFRKPSQNPLSRRFEPGSLPINEFEKFLEKQRNTARSGASMERKNFFATFKLLIK
jgi:hypothetical protein